MSIANISKPSAPSFSNTNKASIGQTWETDLNTWNAELRTWDDTISLMDNINRVSSSMTNIAKP